MAASLGKRGAPGILEVRQHVFIIRHQFSAIHIDHIFIRIPIDKYLYDNNDDVYDLRGNQLIPTYDFVFVHNVPAHYLTTVVPSATRAGH